MVGVKSVLFSIPAAHSYPFVACSNGIRQFFMISGHSLLLGSDGMALVAAEIFASYSPVVRNITRSINWLGEDMKFWSMLAAFCFGAVGYYMLIDLYQRY